jgi:hypothetical protein
VSLSSQPIPCVSYIRRSAVTFWVGKDAVVHSECRNPDGSFSELFIMVRDEIPKRVTWVSLDRNDRRLLDQY